MAGRRSKRTAAAAAATATAVAAVTPPPSSPSDNGYTSSASSTASAATSASTATTNSSRRKVLCLGMSYPSLEKQLVNYNVDPTTWLGRSSTTDNDDDVITVAEVLRCVDEGMLTEMDARDLARCVATEIANNVDVYTVSQEKAAAYKPTRHLEANFNRHRFVHSLHFLFGRDADGNLQQEDANDKYQDRKFNPQFSVQFRQAILDYFWIPQGWDDNHWSPSFFTDILPELVQKGLLDMDDTEKETTDGSIPCGVYLPFCFHVFRQVINALPLLQRYYAISFLRKKDLHEISLWKGTQTIDPRQMQNCLGKQRDQEEVYCTFGYQEVAEAGEGPRDEPRDVLIDILKRLEDFDDIRMIKLQPLKQHNPRLLQKFKKIPKRMQEKGGLKGLVDPRKVKRGFKVETGSGVAAPVFDAVVSCSHQQKVPPSTPRAKKARTSKPVASPKAVKRKRTASLTSPKKKRKQSPPDALEADRLLQATRALFFNTNSAAMPTRAKAKAMSSTVITSTSTLPTRSSRRSVTFVSLPPMINNKRRPSTSSSVAIAAVLPVTKVSPKKKSSKKARTITPSPSIASRKPARATNSATPVSSRALDLNDLDLPEERDNVSSVPEGEQSKRSRKVATKRSPNRRVTKTKPLRLSLQGLESGSESSDPTGSLLQMRPPTAKKPMCSDKQGVVAVVPKPKPKESQDEQNPSARTSPISVLELVSNCIPSMSSFARSPAKNMAAGSPFTNTSDLESEPTQSEYEESADGEANNSSDELASMTYSDLGGSDSEGEQPLAQALRERLGLLDLLLRRRSSNAKMAPEVVQVVVDLDTPRQRSDGAMLFRAIGAGGSSQKAAVVSKARSPSILGNGKEVNVSVLVSGVAERRGSTKLAAKLPASGKKGRRGFNIKKTNKRDITSLRLNTRTDSKMSTMEKATHAQPSVLMFEDFKPRPGSTTLASLAPSRLGTDDSSIETDPIDGDHEEAVIDVTGDTRPFRARRACRDNRTVNYASIQLE